MLVLTVLVTLASLTSLSAKADSVTRLYHKADGNHWFTTSGDKVNQLQSAGWTVEGVAFEAPSSGAPVYVVTSPRGYYHFTSNAEEIAGLVKIGWRQGEVVFYASTSGAAVNRMYNPNAGTHHFTANTDEINNLVKQGWRNEGVAYYVTSVAQRAVPANSSQQPLLTNPDGIVFIARDGESDVFWYDVNNMPSNTNFSRVIKMTEADAVALGKRHSKMEKYAR